MKKLTGRCAFLDSLAALFLFAGLSFAVSAIAEESGGRAPLDTLGSIEITPAHQQDRKMEERLHEIYQRIPGLEEIRVSVDEGVIHLLGEVPSAAAIKEAEKIAVRLDNAVALESELDVKTDLDFRLSALHQQLSQWSNFVLKMIPLFILSIFIIVLGGILAHGVGRLFFLVEKIVPNPFIGSLVIQVVQLCNAGLHRKLHRQYTPEYQAALCPA